MPTAKKTASRLALRHARACWFHRQGLDAPRAESPESVIAKTGWPRTLGGVDVYLAARARIANLRREDLDSAVEDGRLNVTPAVRGCIYVVPRAELPLALRIAEEMWRPRTERELVKAGSSWQEVETLAKVVAFALAAGPQTPEGLRKVLPKGAVRSLGEVGKKIGMSSVLPVALRLLEFEGRVCRRLVDARLDSERYLWQLPKKNPFTGAKLPKTAAERFVALARIFFDHAAPATVREFAEWSGLPLAEAKKAVQALPVVPVSIEAHAEEAWAFDADLKEPPVSSKLTFLSFEDNYLTLHGGPASFIDAQHHARMIPVWGSSEKQPLSQAKHMSLRPLLEGDQLIGFWELDLDGQKVVAATLSPCTQKAALKKQLSELSEFLRDELGHGRSFSLDTDEKVRERAALISTI